MPKIVFENIEKVFFYYRVEVQEGAGRVLRALFTQYLTELNEYINLGRALSVVNFVNLI